VWLQRFCMNPAVVLCHLGTDAWPQGSASFNATVSRRLFIKFLFIPLQAYIENHGDPNRNGRMHSANLPPHACRSNQMCIRWGARALQMFFSGLLQARCCGAWARYAATVWPLGASRHARSIRVVQCLESTRSVALWGRRWTVCAEPHD
jgi:hypothetical protein